MTYYEAYSACRSEAEIKEMAKRDTKVAIFMGGNPDRIKAIEDAMNKAIADIADRRKARMYERHSKTHYRDT